MKRKATVLAAATLAAALSPSISFGGTEAQALQQCVRAMTDDINEENGAPVKVVLDEKSSSSTKRLWSDSVFHLDAADAETGEVVARIDCFVDDKARVLYIRELPLQAANVDRRASRRQLP